MTASATTAVKTTKRGNDWIDEFPGRSGSDRVRETCAKCGGMGNIPAYGFVYNGVCFDCNGCGFTTVTVATVRNRARKAADAADVAVEKESAAKAEAAANTARLAADNPALAAALAVDHPILHDMAVRFTKYGSLSDKQEAFALRLAAEAIEAANAPVVEVPEAPAGRVAVIANVDTIKVVDGFYGPTIKMRVTTLDGWTAWGTVPTAISEVERGDRISFTASFTPADDDPSHAWFSRPAKASVVATAAAVAI